MKTQLVRAAMWIAAIALSAGLIHAGDDPQVALSVRGRTPSLRPDFRLDSDLVLIPVSVTDAKNHPVTGLNREAFRVFEDRAEQTVVHFVREDVPLSVGIVFDSSWSMQGKLAKSREAMRQFLHFANPEDEFFLVEFGSQARLTVPFTDDAGDIENRLINTEAKGKTALLDAVCLATETLKHARYSRRALVILSDGGDNHSRYSETEVLNRVRESDLWIYAMGLFEGGPQPRVKEVLGGPKLLQELVAESGGRSFPVDSLIDLPVVAARISLELRNQYVLGYRPTSPAHDGKYRHVQVNLVDGRGFHVAWRPGYYGTIQ